MSFKYHVFHKKETDLAWPNGEKLALDIWIPSLLLYYVEC